MKEHIHGFDYLRAVMSVFVVIWHFGGAGKSPQYSAEFANYSPTWVDVVNFNLLLLAVPTFFFVSFFLFGQTKRSLTNLWVRVYRLFILYSFWVLAYWFVIRGGPGLSSLLTSFTSNSVNAMVLLFSGAGTVYYFFISLLVITVLGYAFHSRSNRVLLAGLLMCLVAMGALPLVTESKGLWLCSVYWSPLNFVAYMFLGLLFAKNLNTVKRHARLFGGLSVALFLLTAVLEWQFLRGPIHLKLHSYAVPAYMRPSLLFGVAAIGIFFLTRELRSNIVVAFMARYSLALFCLHPFFISYSKSLVNADSAASSLLAAVITIAICYAITPLLSKYLSRNVLF